MMFRNWPVAALAGSLFMLGSVAHVGTASAYPGGTPSYQTDIAPFCAGCHASRSVDMLVCYRGSSALLRFETRFCLASAGAELA